MPPWHEPLTGVPSDLRYSLVVMTRDRPGPLRRCLRSLAGMRWRGRRPELVLVDDGSRPAVEVRPEEVPGFDLVTVRLEGDGVAAARNAGIDASSGDCVAFIADDYVLPGSYLQDVDRFLLERPEAQVISHHIDPRGPLLLAPVQRLYFELTLGQEIPPEQAGQSVIHSFTLPASRAAVFRRGVFDQVGRFNDALRVGEDGEFGKRLADAGIPVHLFRRKRVAHFDAQRSSDYIRQRLRYGRALIRSGVTGWPLERMGRIEFLGLMLGMLGKKVGQWWIVSGRLGIRGRYVALLPFLMLFLSCYYFGAYTEFRHLAKTSFSALVGGPDSGR